MQSQEDTKVTCVRNVAIRLPGAGVTLALSTTNTLPSPRCLHKESVHICRMRKRQGPYEGHKEPGHIFNCLRQVG